MIPYRTVRDRILLKAYLALAHSDLETLIIGLIWKRIDKNGMMCELLLHHALKNIHIHTVQPDSITLSRLHTTPFHVTTQLSLYSNLHRMDLAV